MSRYPFSDHRVLSGSDIRPALLRELTDLYVQKPSHTPEEEQLFTELALRLIDHVDAAERARLGARLAAYPGAPFAVIRRLALPVSPALAERAPSSPDIAPSNLPRIELPHHDETLTDTFFNAQPAERRLILLNLDYAPIAPAALKVEIGVTARLEQAAVTRRRDEFAAALEQMLSVSSVCAHRIAGDSLGEAVVAALKALAVPSPALQRILLFLDPAIGRSADVYFSLVRLYEEIDEEAARRLVSIWRRDDAIPQRRSEYTSQLFDDRPSRARDFTSHDSRPAAGRPSPGPYKTQRQRQTEN